MIQPGPISRVSSAPPAGGLTGLGPLLAVTPAYFVGEWLLLRTHHRPLGAVAFASAAIVIFVVCEAFVRLALTDDVRLSSLGASGSFGSSATWSRLWLRRAVWSAATLGALGCALRALI